MSRDQERKKITLEKKQKGYFLGFAIALAAVAVSNTIAEVYPIANWFTILFVVVAVAHLYCSYKLTP